MSFLNMVCLTVALAWKATTSAMDVKPVGGMAAAPPPAAPRSRPAPPRDVVRPGL
jgi:hypothetical protein